MTMHKFLRASYWVLVIAIGGVLVLAVFGNPNRLAGRSPTRIPGLIILAIEALLWGFLFDPRWGGGE